MKYASLLKVYLSITIISAKIHLSLCKIRNRQVKFHDMTVPQLYNSNISNQCLKRVGYSSEKHTPNDEYENFATTHKKAAAECIPSKPSAKCRVL